MSYQYGSDIVEHLSLELELEIPLGITSDSEVQKEG